MDLEAWQARALVSSRRWKKLDEVGVAFDTETHKRQVGLAAPPLVCASTAVYREGRYVTRVLDRDAALDEFLRILEDPELVMVTANGPYDLLVCATEWARRGRDVLPIIWRALEEGRVYDILIGECLHAIARGHRGKDPLTGSTLRTDKNKPTTYYSLFNTTYLRLGRKDAKANDRWRTSYALLQDVPLALWPPPALQYPQDDARNTLEDALAQCGLVPSCRRHRWDEQGECVQCGADVRGAAAECWFYDPALNLHAMAYEIEAAFALHVGAAWGNRVDQKSVAREVQRVAAERAAVRPKLLELGFLRAKRDKDGDVACPDHDDVGCKICGGSGKVKISEHKAAIATAVARAAGAHGECRTCGGVGRVVNPNKKMPVRRAWDPVKDGKTCLDCFGTGLHLDSAPDLVRTKPSKTYPDGQISADADVLSESASDDLRLLGDYKADQKVVTSYGPALASCGDSPLTHWPNVLIDSDRVSYAGLIQTFPRDGALRACVVARPGFSLCSVDYNQGEVITHGQSLLWIVGKSRQAEVVVQGREIHSYFGATIAGVTYDEFFKDKKKNKKFANIRQACKPWVFGKPGGMGAVKLVQTQRKQGPDTPCPNGPVWIIDEEDPKRERKIRGYRGLRFCVLMDGRDHCGGPGDEMARVWGKGDYERPIAPTCRACLECAERMQRDYYEQFPETRDYFNFVERVRDLGQPLHDWQCDLLDLPRGSYTEPGQQCQHVSCILRGGVTYNDCANGYFQSLLAVAAKRALCICQRECSDRTVRLTWGEFAGGPSPLLGSRCVSFMHDEIFAELRDDRRDAAARRISEVMVRCLVECCPDLAPACKAPPAMAKRWYKAMEAVCSCDKGADCKEVLKGRHVHGHDLVPWEPKPA